MTDLRCARRIHLKALGPIIELRCRDCGALASGPGRRVTVFHRWQYDPMAGTWTEMNDRLTVRDDTIAHDRAA